MDINISSNVAWTATISGTDFTGPSTLDKSVRQGQTKATSGSCPTTASAGPWTPFGAAPYNGSAAWLTGPASPTCAALDLRLVIPGGSMAGSYSGSITYTFSGS